MPKAPLRRPLLKIEAVIGSRNLMRRTAPSPPRQRPSPPEPLRTAKDSRRT
jgi:hypothetical protein